MVLHIALKAAFVVMVLYNLILFIVHWNSGEVFSSVVNNEMHDP